MHAWLIGQGDWLQYHLSRVPTSAGIALFLGVFFIFLFFFKFAFFFNLLIYLFF